MTYLIIFCGAQLSGKTTLVKKLSNLIQVPYVSIDEIRRRLYGYLSSPRDWKNQEIKEQENNKTKFAYDCLFLFIEKCLQAKVSLIAEMPHLGSREHQLRRIIRKGKAKLKIVWCQVLNNEAKEIKKRAAKRLKDKNLAPIRKSDYLIFNSKNQRPSIPHLIIDTSRNIQDSLRKITQYVALTSR
mgnify:CR=1 FL=1